MLDAEDARRANLNGKENLDALVMKWEYANDDLQYARVEIDVFDMLRPWTTVKELSIHGYVGVKFPTWVGHTLFSNMVLLRIESCRKCTSLPAIGQLPSLKGLVIIGMTKVESVGPKFYGKVAQNLFNLWRHFTLRICRNGKIGFLVEMSMKNSLACVSFLSLNAPNCKENFLSICHH